LDSYVICDTDVIIDFFSVKGGSANLVYTLIEHDRLALSSITTFELYSGVTGKKRISQIDKLVSFASVLPFSLSESIIAAQIYSNLKQSGMLIGNQDICIAATCIARNFPLYTRNFEHFKRIPNLRLMDPASMSQDDI
jgi:tRNA(fMet)-specific endonuclease VapC